MCNCNKHQGFSLIELMIVIAIIGVMAAIAVPSYQHYIMKSRMAEMFTGLNSLATQIAEHIQEGNSDCNGMNLPGVNNGVGTYTYPSSAIMNQTINVWGPNCNMWLRAEPSKFDGKEIYVNLNSIFDASGGIKYDCTVHVVNEPSFSFLAPSNCEFGT